MMRQKEKPPRLPPEYPRLPEFSPPAPEFIRSYEEAGMPLESTATPELAAPRDEFSSGGGPAGRSPSPRRLFHVAAVFTLTAALTLLPAVPAPPTPMPPAPVPVESVPTPVPAEPAPEQTPQVTDAPEQTVPCSLYLTYVSGSYCMVDAELTRPETISSVHLTLTDTISGKQFFTVDLSRAEIDAGRYSAVFNRNPEDIWQYWAEYGEGAFPSFNGELTVERTDGETEKSSKQAEGNVFSNINRWRDDDGKSLTVSVWDTTEYAAVFANPESVNEKTLSFTAYVDGKPLAADAYSVSYSTQEFDLYNADGTPTGETNKFYTADISTSLPDGASDIVFTLDVLYDGHVYTYTEKIR